MCPAPAVQDEAGAAGAERAAGCRREYLVGPGVRDVAGRLVLMSRASKLDCQLGGQQHARRHYVSCSKWHKA